MSQCVIPEQGIEPQQPEIFLRISHTLGHLSHYDYDPTLRNIVILKPDWQRKAIGFVLDNERFAKVVPYLKIVMGILTRVLPVATSASKLMLDETAYKVIEPQLDLGQKSIESISKGSDLVIDSSIESDAPDFAQGEAIRVQGSILRELHALLKEKYPSFGSKSAGAEPTPRISVGSSSVCG